MNFEREKYLESVAIEKYSRSMLYVAILCSIIVPILFAISSQSTDRNILVDSSMGKLVINILDTIKK